MGFFKNQLQNYIHRYKLFLETKRKIDETFDPIISKIDETFDPIISKHKEDTAKHFQEAKDAAKDAAKKFQEALTKINESASEKGFFANFKDGFDKSQGSNEPSKSSRPNTNSNPYMSGETRSCIAQIERVEMDIKIYQEKYDEGMRSSNAGDREYAHNSYYDLIINRTKELGHLRTRLEQSLHRDSFQK
jgi:hypothetical protein